MLDIKKWAVLRQQEQDFHYANGFNNENPNTNGEFLCTDYFMDRGIDTFSDIGTNAGIFTRRVLENYADISIYAYEPNPKHAEALKTLARNNKALNFYPIAISDEKGKFDFHHHPVHHEHRVYLNAI